MKRAFYYSPIFLEHKPPDYHPENPKRTEAIVTAIEEDPILNKIPFIEPQEADRSIIALNHSSDYIDKIENLSGYGYLDTDTYFSPLSAKAAFLAVGSGINSINEIVSDKIDRSFCLVRPPGHHAENERAMGFCLFNNTAITARYALTKGIKKIAIVDFDAHHGNGTQHSFFNSKQVLYISLHHYPFYPGTGAIEESGNETGAGFTVNIPFPSGANSADYKLAFDKIVMPILLQYRAELIIISAGYDAHKSDPLGGLSLDENGFAYMASCINSIAVKGIILFLEGGYDINSLTQCALKTFRILADIKEQSQAKRLASKERTLAKPKFRQVVEEVVRFQSKYWSI